MLGLGAVAGCRLSGAERIICVDLSEDRLVLGRGQGVDPFISHHLSLDEVNRGFELMERQDGIRSVISLA